MANLKETRKYHFTYKTTNLVNGRYYLGMHSTNRIDDGYLGSGKRLYYELNKYGRDSFTFEILEQFSSREELVQAEIRLITEQDLINLDCLNLKPGGSGGFSKEWVERGRELANAARLKLLKTDPEFKKKFGEAIIKGQSEARIGGVQFSNIAENYSWIGKKHSLATIEKMKEAKKGHGRSITNSQYGTCWITNQVENKKINKESTIPEGWKLGRVTKK